MSRGRNAATTTIAGRDGVTGRIAVDGTTPMHAYAPPITADGRPRIALVISGLGISAKATDAALKSLPAQVTLSFAPYEADAQRWVSQARDGGHEVLLEVPMESYDFPDSDLGPHTLRSGATDDANTQRLIWAMTRGGPVNATHLMATLSYQRAIIAGQLGEGAAISSAMIPFLLAAIMVSWFGLQRRKWQQGENND